MGTDGSFSRFSYCGLSGNVIFHGIHRDREKLLILPRDSGNHVASVATKKASDRMPLINTGTADSRKILNKTCNFRRENFKTKPFEGNR